jgi:hypothetical protein
MPQIDVHYSLPRDDGNKSDNAKNLVSFLTPSAQVTAHQTEFRNFRVLC